MWPKFSIGLDLQECRNQGYLRESLGMTLLGSLPRGIGIVWPLGSVEQLKANDALVWGACLASLVLVEGQYFTTTTCAYCVKSTVTTPT